MKEAIVQVHRFRMQLPGQFLCLRFVIGINGSLDKLSRWHPKPSQLFLCEQLCFVHGNILLLSRTI
jgi:hypothetical protein